MKKKYTMEQFMEMYDEAQVATIDELMKDFEENKKEDKDGQSVMFMLHNIMVTSVLKKNLFKIKEGE